MMITAEIIGRAHRVVIVVVVVIEVVRGVSHVVLKGGCGLRTQ